MRQISQAELHRQVTREGRRWKLHAMVSQVGGILVAEDIPCLIPLTRGLNVIVPVRRDITSISQNYPWSCLLRNRKHKAERTAALRTEITLAQYQAEVRRRKEAMVHELSGDIKAKDKGRIILLGK